MVQLSAGIVPGPAHSFPNLGSGPRNLYQAGSNEPAG